MQKQWRVIYEGPPIDSYSAAQIKGVRLLDGLGLEIAFDNLSARLVVIELFCLIISVLHVWWGVVISHGDNLPRLKQTRIWQQNYQPQLPKHIG